MILRLIGLVLSQCTLAVFTARWSSGVCFVMLGEAEDRGVESCSTGS